MENTSRRKDTIGHRPVRPTPVQHHGFFGNGFVRQHMMMDNRWTPNSLTEEFTKMSELLENRLQFHNLEKELNKKKRLKMHQSLRKECREGRSYLNYIKSSGDKQYIRNLLINHRHMQRLYQHMPVNMVEENINQGTFVKRKQRDRLRSRLEKMKTIYEKKLVQQGSAENRIRYQNEFILQEELSTNDLKMKIANSHTRMEAVKAINSTYKKIIQILRHDEIFYEPILHSLDSDIKDQENFIEHILVLGAPAIKRFKELSDQHRIMTDRNRKTIQMNIQQYSNLGRADSKVYHKFPKLPGQISYKVRRYVRETRSMLELKSQLENVEETIKQVKFATLSSKETELYPRIKSQVVNNLKLITQIDNDMLQSVALDTKMKCGTVLQGVLENNLSDDGLRILDRIKQLRVAIKEEDEYQEETLAHIKNHSDCFVLLRFALWNIHDIMRHVGPRRMPFLKYPVDYLKLPLLKYDMLIMTACPPDPFEVDIPTLMKVVQYKLKLVMKAFDSSLTPRTMNEFKTSYCNQIDAADNISINTTESKEQNAINNKSSSDLLEKVKTNQMVPNRKHIKMASARIIEDCLKKDE